MRVRVSPQQSLVATAIVFSLVTMFVTSFLYLFSQTPKLTRPFAPGETALGGFENPKDRSMRISGLVAQLRETPADLPLLLRVAELHMTVGEWGMAEEFLKKGISLDPQDVRCRHLLAACQFSSGRPDLAAGTYVALLSVKDDPLALFYLASIYKYHLGRQGDAQELFQLLLTKPDMDEDLAQAALQELESGINIRSSP